MSLITAATWHDVLYFFDNTFTVYLFILLFLSHWSAAPNVTTLKGFWVIPRSEVRNGRGCLKGTPGKWWRTWTPSNLVPLRDNAQLRGTGAKVFLLWHSRIQVLSRSNIISLRVATTKTNSSSWAINYLSENTQHTVMLINTTNPMKTLSYKKLKW